MILALDTATGIAVALLSDDGAELAAASSREERQHAELLAVLVEQVLRDAGVEPAELTAVAVGTGPAPYTGLRVGLVTAGTLADALGVPLYGVCSLDALAAAAGADDVVAVTDAKRKEVYWARYAAGRLVGGPAVAKPDVLTEDLPEGIVVVGWDGYPGARAAQVDAATLGGLALERAARGEDQPATPLYLRRPDATPNIARPIATH